MGHSKGADCGGTLSCVVLGRVRAATPQEEYLVQDDQSRAQVRLLADLTAIFPEFAQHWASECEGERPPRSLHSVWLTLASCFERLQADEIQLARLAECTQNALSGGGIAENAVTTGFLEALRRRSPRTRQLRPLLSVQARKRLR